MKKRMKRWTCLLLTVCLLLGGLPLTVFAVEEGGEEGAPKVCRYTVLVLDHSISMFGEPFTAMQTAASKFCRQMLEAEGENYVAIVPYQAAVGNVVDFTKELLPLRRAIYSLDPRGGGTNTNAALQRADALLSAVPSTDNTVKSIVLMSDGLPMTGDTAESGRYSTKYGGIRAYPYANQCYETAVKLQSRYNIRTLGFFHNMQGEALSFAQEVMQDIQNKGYYQVIDPAELEFIFDEIAGDILRPDGLLERTFRFPSQFTSNDIDVSCYYSDSYFYGDAKDYRPDLATMSLCFELTSWARSDEMYGGDKEAGWTTDIGHADPRFKNARDLLTGSRTDAADGQVDEAFSGLGFQSFAVNHYWAERPTKDSIGAVAASKTLNAPDGCYTLIALAVRGGGYQQEWASNLTIGPAGDHAGFAKARDEVLDFLTSYIHQKNITGPVKLWLVGYSRAGVTANMLAGKLMDDPSLLPDVTLAQKDLYAYTFEAPQGALEAGFSDDAVYTSIHNIVNVKDPVPLVAPTYWGFARYNTEQDRVINNPSTVANYALVKQRVRAFFTGIPYTGAYDVKETTAPSKIAINWKEWRPGGEPFLYLEEFMDPIPTEQMMDRTFPWVFNVVFGGRYTYTVEAQALLCEISAIKNGRSLTETLEIVHASMTPQQYIDIISPLFAPGMDMETKVERAAAKYEQFLTDQVDLSMIAWSVTKMKASLKKLFTRVVLWELASMLQEKEFSDIHGLMGLFAGEGELFQAHYPEVTLAWMMAQDSNYGGALDHIMANNYRIIRINCPVDVAVYDAAGKLAAQIADGHMVEVPDSELPAYVNGDGEKIVHLPPDADYTVSLYATGEGAVHLTLEEYSLSTMSTVRTLIYDPVAVSDGDTLTVSVPALPHDELQSGIPTGSSASYTFSGSDGQAVNCRDMSGAPAQYTVTVKASESETTYGLVSGGGVYTEGSFAQVEAFPMTDSNFEGWYDGYGGLVSSEAVYRFPVTQETTLTAQFAPVPFHQLTVQAGPGGSVENKEQIHVPGGVRVSVVALPDEGSTFSGWTCDAGFLEDASAPETWFYMPEGDAVVTATFSGGSAEPTPSITLDTQSLTFPPAKAGYDTQALQFIYVRNDGARETGRLKLTLSGENADAFNLGFDTMFSIPAGESGAFGVIPKRGLNAGTYTATVTISSGDTVLCSVDLSFTVE